MVDKKARESFATGFSVAGHIDGKENSSDIITKPVSPSEVYNHNGTVIFGRILKYYQRSTQGELHNYM